jgi:hypothetical protein
MNCSKSRATNCGQMSELIRGFGSGYFSLARSRIDSMSVSLIDSRRFRYCDGLRDRRCQHGHIQSEGSAGASDRERASHLSLTVLWGGKLRLKCRYWMEAWDQMKSTSLCMTSYSRDLKTAQFTR